MAGQHRRRKRATTTDDYAAMMARMVRAYGKRIGTDPQAGLAHLRELEAAMADAVNLGIYSANRDGGRSINDLADMLGVSKQAIHNRVKLGEQLAVQRGRQDQAAITARVAKPRELPPAQDGR
jgi:hypothetical protein